MNYLEEILRELCSRVNADYDSIDFQSEDWYFKHSWTLEQENDFCEWLKKQLYNNKKMRNEIMIFPRKNKEDIGKVVAWFNLSYGWKVTE